MQSVREVYSLLMPIQDGRLVIPRAAVAEVMGYSRPKDRPENAPDFLLGFVDWQDQRIPLVSFEAAQGKGVPELGRRTRIAVVFGIGGRLKPDVFAVVTQGYPYLVRVNENVLQPEAFEEDDALILARVRMANEKPYIPDMETLENRIADSLGIDSETADTAKAEEVDELDAFATGEEEEFEAGLLEGDAEEFEAPTEDVAESDAGEPSDAEISLDDSTDSGDYASDLDEFSASLEAEDGDTELEIDVDDEDFAVDLSGFELDEDIAESTEKQEGANSADSDEAEEEIEIDLSDLSIDFDDDEDPQR